MTLFLFPFPPELINPFALHSWAPCSLMVIFVYFSEKNCELLRVKNKSCSFKLYSFLLSLAEFLPFLETNLWYFMRLKLSDEGTMSYVSVPLTVLTKMLSTRQSLFILTAWPSCQKSGSRVSRAEFPLYKWIWEKGKGYG